ncbi:MAG TPA: hypothetical protein VE861_06370 [Gemmatimonadaceae bacterium]|nr:hypothetical protein [Gemmatimonadaceae bacterium]
MAVALAGLVLVMLAIRVAGDAAGIQRATTASHVLSAVSFFLLMISIQAVMPWIMPGALPAGRKRERLYRVSQIAAVGAVIQFLVLYGS